PTRGPGDQPAEAMVVGAAWPRADAAAISDPLEERFGTLQELIRQIRNLRTQHNVPPRQEVEVIVQAGGEQARLLCDHADLVRSLAQVGNFTVTADDIEQPADAAAAPVGALTVYVLGIIDREAEIARLEKQKATLDKGIEGIEKKLGNENFVNKAPENVVQRERDRLAELKSELETVESSLAALK
ncbi:MAG: hypothetical protein ACOC93_02635, partial [Planctomycetota bacterium]